MKKTVVIGFAVMLGLLAVSCSRDITEPTISSTPTEPAAATLALPSSFTSAYGDSLVKFSWSGADFGYSASITYSVQMSSTSDFSKNVGVLLTTQKLSGAVKVSDVNSLILAWGDPIGTPKTVYFRVSASVASSLPAVYSSVKSTTLTPYEALIDYPMVYVPGSYQGWSPGAANGRLYSYGVNSQYSSIVRLVDTTTTTTQFKITNSPDWNHTNWGGTLTASGDNYSGILNPTGDNFQAKNACYVLTVDVTALTISLTKTSDWGIIGSAVPPYDWSKDVNMYYNGQRKMWEITADFRAGEFKFRANDAWDLNYGDNGANGSLEAGGANIALSTAGNYTIRFDPVALTYTVKKN